jgi:hypothetical protein
LTAVTIHSRWHPVLVSWPQVAVSNSFIMLCSSVAEPHHVDAALGKSFNATPTPPVVAASTSFTIYQANFFKKINGNDEQCRCIGVTIELKG